MSELILSLSEIIIPSESPDGPALCWVDCGLLLPVSALRPNIPPYLRDPEG